MPRGRFDSLLEGADLVYEDETGSGGFNYWGYQRTDGSGVIVRVKTDETETTYALYPNKIHATFALFWTNKATANYQLPEAFG